MNIYSLYLFVLIVLLGVFGLEMYHSLRRSSVVNRLIRTYSDDVHSPELLPEIYAYCQSDWKLRRIMKKYEATPEDFQKIYHKLLIWGNFRKGRRFVPISSFFYVYTLEYLLQHKNGDAKQLTMKCMNFFHI